MKIQFVDLSIQDLPDRVFATQEELLSFIHQQQSKGPAAGELIGENGYKLTFGLDGMVAFVQYSSTDDDPPYLVAQANTRIPSESHEFLMRGSPTEVEAKNCISSSELEQIVVEFMKSGNQSAVTAWADA